MKQFHLISFDIMEIHAYLFISRVYFLVFSFSVSFSPHNDENFNQDFYIDVSNSSGCIAEILQGFETVYSIPVRSIIDSLVLTPDSLVLTPPNFLTFPNSIFYTCFAKNKK